MDGVTSVPTPVNEVVLTYRPGSPERSALLTSLADLERHPSELTMTIGGQRRLGGGPEMLVVQPHEHGRVLGMLRGATHQDAADAVDAAGRAAADWRCMSFDDRAGIFLKAAELLAGPWRQALNAATMLGQSKTVHQAEIDAVCELVDFWRFNVHFARQILAEQPVTNSAGVWNRIDHRPLEGFVYAVTPFNFTSIAGNLPTAPALMGNVVVWKPSPNQQLSAHLIMRLLEAAGLPPGVINMVTGDGVAVSEVVLADPGLAGLHFTGSTPTFQGLWQGIAEHLSSYRNYPRIVGETGGKDFVLAHPSADPNALVTALIRGAFEYQGQKCSAASRAYIPQSLWDRIRDDLVERTDALAMGPPTDLSNFLGALIDRTAFARVIAVLDRARADPSIRVLAGGDHDDSVGFFVRPTVLTCTDPTNDVFVTEYFGPILAVYVFEDTRYEAVLHQMESVARYALTGSIFAEDRRAIAQASDVLRYAAGNFYINDKPTGAVVGQQPFGGARGSGTNDKAGAAQNLLRWTSTRAIKETFIPPARHEYPHMSR